MPDIRRRGRVRLHTHTAKARDVLERAVAIFERTHGRDHTRVAVALGNLGTAYGNLGDYAKARGVLERALVIQERGYGRDHPEVAKNLYNIATAHGYLGDIPKARELLERAIAIFESAGPAYAPGNPHTNMCLEALANLPSSSRPRSGSSTCTIQ